MRGSIRRRRVMRYRGTRGTSLPANAALFDEKRPDHIQDPRRASALFPPSPLQNVPDHLISASSVKRGRSIFYFFEWTLRWIEICFRVNMNNISIVFWKILFEKFYVIRNYIIAILYNVVKIEIYRKIYLIYLFLLYLYCYDKELELDTRYDK